MNTSRTRFSHWFTMALLLGTTHCGPGRVQIHHAPRPEGANTDHVELLWILSPLGESREDPNARTEVALVVRGTDETRVKLGAYPGNCWTNRQGWQRAPSQALTSVQCVSVGEGTSIHVMRPGRESIEVREYNVDETEPTPTASRLLATLPLPAQTETIDVAAESP